jgi:hypothetical protein
LCFFEDIPCVLLLPLIILDVVVVVVVVVVIIIISSRDFRNVFIGKEEEEAVVVVSVGHDDGEDDVEPYKAVVVNDDSRWHSQFLEDPFRVSQRKLGTVCKAETLIVNIQENKANRILFVIIS